MPQSCSVSLAPWSSTVQSGLFILARLTQAAPQCIHVLHKKGKHMESTEQLQNMVMVNRANLVAELT